MRPTRTFKVSGLLTALGVVAVAAAPRHSGGWAAFGIVLLVLACPVFLVSLTRLLLRGLLWRVGSRLAVSYLLLLSAFVFAAFFVYGGLLVVAGQLGTRRVEAAIEKRHAELLSLARDLAPRGRAAAPPSEVAPRPWMTDRGVYLVRQSPAIYAVAIVPSPNGPVVLAERLDTEFRRALEKETGNVIRFFGAVKVREENVDKPKGGVRLSLDTPGRRKQEVNLERERGSGGDSDAGGASAAPPAGSGPWSGRWSAFPLFLRQSVIDAETGRPLEKQPALFLVRTSLAHEAAELFRDVTVSGSSRSR